MLEDISRRNPGVINPIATDVHVPKPLKLFYRSPIYIFMVKAKFVFCVFLILSAQSSTKNKYLVCQYLAKLFML